MKLGQILCVAIACVTLFGSGNLLRAADRNERHVLLTNAWFMAAKTNAKDDIDKAIASKDDVNQTNNNKWKETALHVAVMYNSVEAAQAIIAHGGNVNAVDEDGRIPLQYALNDKKLPMAGVLLDGGSDVNNKGKDGVTALMRATRYGWTDIIKKILDKKPDINAQESHGQTALYEAAIWGQADSAKMLLDAGADATLHDSKGRTPMDVAIAKNHADVVKVLKDHNVTR
jgi:ankyrin repeat protein